MSKEELLQFLKDNLQVKVNHQRRDDYIETKVSIYLGDELITDGLDSEDIKTY